MVRKEKKIKGFFSLVFILVVNFLNHFDGYYLLKNFFFFFFQLSVKFLPNILNRMYAVPRGGKDFIKRETKGKSRLVQYN